MESAVDEVSREVVAKLTTSTWPLARLEARRKLYQNLGLDPLPPRIPNTPPRLIRRIERDGYTIECLILEPRPHFLLPIHLYVPNGVLFPAPAILYAPGHWMISGKTEPDIQACCIGLAKLGFVVLVFDPIGQGERGASFADHGRRDFLLLGLSQEGLMVWESMCAIDYLLTRSEVDGNRIGMTGASGGGLNTIYTSAADERISAVVPVCYVTSFSRFFRAMRDLNWNNADDLCNQVPNVIRDADMGGLCGLIHPRPLLVINGWLDPQFPVIGAQEVVDQVKEIYEQVDAKRLQLTAIDSDHGYNQQMREAAYGWFKYWLQGLGDGSPSPEPPLTTELPESQEMKCFLGSPSISSGPALRLFSRTTAEQLRQRHEFATDSKFTLISRLRDCLGIQSTADQRAMMDTIESSIDLGYIHLQRRLLHPETGILMPAFTLFGTTPQRLIVYACDEGKLAEHGHTLFSIAPQTQTAVLAVDPRGIGETTPLPSRPMTLSTLDGKIAEFPITPGFTLEFEAATDALMLGRSLLGQQVCDLLYAVRYAQSLFPGVQIKLAGSGPRMALAALFAAALEDTITTIWADRLLPSYHLLVDEDDQVFPITAYVFGILKVSDIPAVVDMIAPRELLITRAIDTRLQPLEIGEAHRILQLRSDNSQLYSDITTDILNRWIMRT